MLQCSIPRVASTNSEGSPIAPAADAFLARGISSLEAPLLKGSALTEAPGVSVRGMAVNLVTGGLGAGILTLPWGMAGASVLTALLLTVLVVVLNGFTIMILVRAAEARGRSRDAYCLAAPRTAHLKQPPCSPTRVDSHHAHGKIRNIRGSTWAPC